jgi:UPF0755 protein
MKKYSYILIVILLLALAGIWLWREIQLPKEPGSESQVVFQIEKGQGLADISANLKKEGLIKSEILFNLFTLVQGVQDKLQAGKYSLSPGMNIPEILKKLTQGETIKEKITIIEGWNLKDIANYFKEKGLLKKEEELFQITGAPASNSPQPKDFSEEFEFLKEKPKNLSLEGYLFPDTYEIDLQSSIEEIVKKMLKNFDEKITPDLREEIKKQGKTLHQVLTMASILEKEFKDYKDKQIAAGILWKRLQSGWPLQVDATLTYLTGKGSLELTKKDLQIDSPYNTYRYYGLPPGPICNPGLDSIKAAIYYKESPYWFYLTTSEGKTIFSRTLKEHNEARWRYLK